MRGWKRRARSRVRSRDGSRGLLDGAAVLVGIGAATAISAVGLQVHVLSVSFVVHLLLCAIARLASGPWAKGSHQ